MPKPTDTGGLLKGLRMLGVIERLANAVGVVVFGLVAFMFAWPVMEGIHALLDPPPSIEWRLSEAAQRAYESGDTRRGDLLRQAEELLNEGRPVRDIPPPF